jgi:hypothetical protein
MSPFSKTPPRWRPYVTLPDAPPVVKESSDDRVDALTSRSYLELQNPRERTASAVCRRVRGRGSANHPRREAHVSRD